MQTKPSSFHQIYFHANKASLPFTKLIFMQTKPSSFHQIYFHANKAGFHSPNLFSCK